MNCTSCIDNSQFYFTISYSKEGIIYNDQSIWRTPENGVPESTYDVTFGIGDSSKIFTVGVNTATLIRSKDFVLPTCPDGIYTVSTTICDQPFERTVAILPQTECRLNTLILAQRWDEAETVIEHLEYLKADAKLGLEDRANQRYEILDAFLNKINCKCNASVN